MSEIDELKRRIELKRQLLYITQEEIAKLEEKLIEKMLEQEG
jgi:hypothetical protein